MPTLPERVCRILLVARRKQCTLVPNEDTMSATTLHPLPQNSAAGEVTYCHRCRAHGLVRPGRTDTAVAMGGRVLAFCSICRCVRWMARRRLAG